MERPEGRGGQHPRLGGVATAVPPYRLEQGEARKLAAGLFRSSLPDLDRLLTVFGNSQIEVRYLSQPLEWYGRPHSFAESNARYREVALELAHQASRRALERSAVPSEEVGLVLFVSTTGFSTPSLDARLIQELGLPAQTGRMPIWGLGCAGGVSGLGRAAELARAVPGRTVLLVTVELCSLTFQHGDYSKSNLIAASLFGDGAAAALLGIGGKGPEIHGHYSVLLPDSAEVMGWDLVETGLKVRFSRNIPALIRQHLPDLLLKACRSWGLPREAIRHFVLHPGGAKVLEAYAQALGVPEDQLEIAYQVLRQYGNISSASVLFVLERFLKSVPRSGQFGVIMAFGPGFSAEQVLFKW
ncbi:MAG: stilbene synthase [Deltaproteobacteria bacterium]|nr:stilbene synthase [Deltaproteobacteria bacterium]